MNFQMHLPIQYILNYGCIYFEEIVSIVTVESSSEATSEVVLRLVVLVKIV